MLACERKCSKFDDGLSCRCWQQPTTKEGHAQICQVAQVCACATAKEGSQPEAESATCTQSLHQDSGQERCLHSLQAASQVQTWGQVCKEGERITGPPSFHSVVKQSIHCLLHVYLSCYMDVHQSFLVHLLSKSFDYYWPAVGVANPQMMILQYTCMAALHLLYLIYTYVPASAQTGEHCNWHVFWLLITEEILVQHIAVTPRH